MTGNAVDASSFSPPDHLAAQQAGMRILLNMAELNIFYQGTGLVSTQRYIAKNRDLVRRMVRVTSKRSISSEPTPRSPSGRSSNTARPKTRSSSKTPIKRCAKR